MLFLRTQIGSALQVYTALKHSMNGLEDFSAQGSHCSSCAFAPPMFLLHCQALPGLTSLFQPGLISWCQAGPTIVALSRQSLQRPHHCKLREALSPTSSSCTCSAHEASDFRLPFITQDTWLLHCVLAPFQGQCAGVGQKTSQGDCATVLHKALLNVSFDASVYTVQEWNEIQYNGVYYNPPKKGKPGELPAADTSYTFKYPRPERYITSSSTNTVQLPLETQSHISTHLHGLLHVRHSPYFCSPQQATYPCHSCSWPVVLVSVAALHFLQILRSDHILCNKNNMSGTFKE